MKSYHKPHGSQLLSILAQGQSSNTVNEKENHQHNPPGIKCHWLINIKYTTIYKTKFQRILNEQEYRILR